jgi:hypothetical protein
MIEHFIVGLRLFVGLLHANQNEQLQGVKIGGTCRSGAE